MSRRGRFIAIEGTDGSGKATQARLLAQALRRRGRNVRTIAFPQYGQKSAGAIEAYLNGAYGSAKEVGPYGISIIYAVDRAAARKKLTNWLKNGYTVIADRFTASNHAYVGAVLSAKEQKRFWRWADDFEYHTLKLPRPDRTIVLTVPPRIAQRLILKKRTRHYLKRNKRDLHELDVGYQARVLRTYRELARHDRRMRVVECHEHGRLLSKQEVHRRVLTSLRGVV